jgi:hypothetical protein
MCLVSQSINQCAAAQERIAEAINNLAAAVREGKGA